MNRERLVSTAFSEMADVLAEDHDLPDLLQLLVDRAAAVVGADATGVFLDDQRGGLQLCASSTHAVGPQRVLATAALEGPCFDAFRSARIMTGHEAIPSTWPRLSSAMATADLTTAHAVPLRARRQVVGSLGLFFVDDVALVADDIAVVEAMVRVAGLGFFHERGTDRDELIAAQLHSALRVRVLVEQAKGVVAETLGTSVGDAFDRLKSHTLSTDTPMAEVASRVLDGSLSPQDMVVRSAAEGWAQH
jgi:hypothetical protein